MLKTAEINRFEKFACPKKASGVKLTLALTLVLHALVFGALAAITIQVANTKAKSSEVEATFTPVLTEPLDLSSLESAAQQKPAVIPIVTEPQLRELPYAPQPLDLSDLTQPEIETEAGSFDTNFLRKKETPPTKAKPVKKSSTPPVKKKQAAKPKTAPTPTFTQAKVHSTARPKYPDSARRNGHQGTANVSLTVDSSGKVTAASISKSSGNAALDAAAVRAAKRWKFKPATSGGRPVSTKIVIPITFKLK